MFKKLGFLFPLLLFLILVSTSYAERTLTTQARVPVPVKITVANENWATTFTICNTTSSAIPLQDIELSFNYQAKVSGNIWGDPWAAWRVAKNDCCGQIILLGGTQWTPALQPDPNCTKPMTVVFAANPATPLPTGPFVFKAVTETSSGAGQINITLAEAPSSGLANPKVTVSGNGVMQEQIVTWGSSWLVSNLPPATYVVTASAVDNGSEFFQANPVNATVNAQATTQVAVVYTRVDSPRGKLTIQLPATPAAGVSNPSITVSGAGTNQTQVVAWGNKWEVSNLAPGSYTVTSTKVSNQTDSYEAKPVTATVNAQANTDVTLTYTKVPVAQGSLNVSVGTAPASGVGNPTITVTGGGTTRQQVVNWGSSWLVPNLTPGSYTVTSSTVSNSSASYQAQPVTANVVAGSTAQATLSYTQVQPGRPASWSKIKHVVIVILENEKASDSIAQPFMKSLTTEGAYTSQMFAITHPSQPNYIALAAGSTLGVTSNSNRDLDGLHIGDLFDAKGLSWKAYAEDLPSTPCYKGEGTGKYDRKHEPFISFRSVQNNPAQCAKIVNASQFFTDIANNRLPTYSFYVPNEDNNGHDTDVRFADQWLQRVFGPIFNDTSILADTLFIVTYDEDDGGANNHIYTSFIGAAVNPAANSTKRYTLYSILRTIEEIFQVGNLGRNDASAAVINDIWQP